MKVIFKKYLKTFIEKQIDNILNCKTTFIIVHTKNNYKKNIIDKKLFLKNILKYKKQFNKITCSQLDFYYKKHCKIV